jgi:hypothetical protein
MRASAKACGCRVVSGETSPAPLQRVTKTWVQGMTARPSGNNKENIWTSAKNLSREIRRLFYWDEEK